MSAIRMEQFAAREVPVPVPMSADEGAAQAAVLRWRAEYDLALPARKLKARGNDLQRERGFWLNDHFTAHAVRHMIQHRPEWDGIFELRELDVSRGKRKVRVVVIEEKEAA